MSSKEFDEVAVIRFNASGKIVFDMQLPPDVDDSACYSAYVAYRVLQEAANAGFFFTEADRLGLMEDFDRRLDQDVPVPPVKKPVQLTLV